MRPWIAWLAALSLASLPLGAQERREEHHEGPRPNAPVGHGYVPSRGPAPVRNTPPVVHNQRPAPVVERGQPDPRHHAFRDQADHPEIPHVHPQRDQWVGHASGRNDSRYHLDRPWAHGHFTGGFGPRYVYPLRGAPERFLIDGQAFAVAPADEELIGDWDWDDDNIVLYADPDHDGFYLAYNPRLGTYAHVEYLGG